MKWVDGRDRGLWFPTERKLRRPQFIVLHWTGGNRGADGVVQTLRNRGLGIHGVLEADGTFVQTAEFDTHQAHAGKFNAFSVGIEMVNPGTGPTTDPRPQVTEEVHGRRITYHDFTEAQYAALPQVLARISAATGIPLKVKLSSTAIPHDFRGWSGVIGHYQITTNKNDPGPNVLRYISSLRKALTGGALALVLTFVGLGLVLASSGCGGAGILAAESARVAACQAAEEAVERRCDVDADGECTGDIETAEAWARIDATRSVCDELHRRITDTQE